MTHAYRVRFATHINPTGSPAASRALTALVLSGVIAAVIWTFVAVGAQTARQARSMAAARTAIVRGMSRADCYAWLRDHGLTAANPAYAVWRKNRLGVWYRANDGAWPLPGERRNRDAGPPPDADHPDALVKLSAAPGGTCGTATMQLLTFDRNDRIKHVAYSQPYWTCQ